MRPGFWNRLALVAAVLFALIGATWTVVSLNEKSRQRHQQGYEECLDQVVLPGSGMTVETCRVSWLETRSMLGWDDWWEAFALLLVVSAVLYAVIAVAVAVAKWVWRGRTAA